MTFPGKTWRYLKGQRPNGSTTTMRQLTPAELLMPEIASALPPSARRQVTAVSLGCEQDETAACQREVDGREHGVGLERFEERRPRLVATATRASSMGGVG